MLSSCDIKFCMCRTVFRIDCYYDIENLPNSTLSNYNQTHKKSALKSSTFFRFPVTGKVNFRRKVDDYF